MTTFNTGNPLGSTDVYDRYDNSENLDNFSNGPLDSYPDRFGVSRQSLQGIRNASQYVDLGPYAAGMVFTSRNQVFSYDAGSGAEFYSPGPSITLPYTTTGAGAGEIANFRSVGDAILRADLDSTAAGKGADLVAGAARVIYASEWGCVAGADISTPLTAAAAAADARGVPLVMDIPNAILGTPFIAPRRFDGGGCVFTGDVIVRYRKDAEVGTFTCTNLKVQAVWRSNIHNIVCTNDFSVEGYDPAWGVFYSDFRYVIAAGKLRIDAALQAVNGNSFSVCGGHGAGDWGLLITDSGAVTSGGIMEAHGNSFFNCDFSQSLGAYNAIAVRNQTNNLYNCYFELGAQVVGNWTSIGGTIDGQSPPIVGQFNHVLASTDVNSATQGDSLSATLNNLCAGGAWDVRDSAGIPPGFAASYAAVVSAISGTPYGYIGTYGGTPTGANHYLDVKFSTPTGKFSALVWLYCPTGELPYSIEVYDGTTTSYRTPGEVHNAGGGFYLYRVSGVVVANSAAVIRFYVSNASAVVRTISIGAAYVTSSKAAIFPSYSAPVSSETIHVSRAEIKRGIKGQGYVSGAASVDIVITYGNPFLGSLSGVPAWSVKPAAGFEGKMTKTELIASSGSAFTVRLYYTADWAGDIYWSSVSA